MGREGVCPDDEDDIMAGENLGNAGIVGRKHPRVQVVVEGKADRIEEGLVVRGRTERLGQHDKLVHRPFEGNPVPGDDGGSLRPRKQRGSISAPSCRARLADLRARRKGLGDVLLEQVARSHDEHWPRRGRLSDLKGSAENLG